MGKNHVSLYANRLLIFYPLSINSLHSTDIIVFINIFSKEGCCWNIKINFAIDQVNNGKIAFINQFKTPKNNTFVFQECLWHVKRMINIFLDVPKNT